MSDKHPLYFLFPDDEATVVLPPCLEPLLRETTGVVGTELLLGLGSGTVVWLTRCSMRNLCRIMGVPAGGSWMGKSKG